MHTQFTPLPWFEKLQGDFCDLLILDKINVINSVQNIEKLLVPAAENYLAKSSNFKVLKLTVTSFKFIELLLKTIIWFNTFIRHEQLCLTL